MRPGYVLICATTGSAADILESLITIPFVHEAYNVKGSCDVHATLYVETEEQFNMASRQIAKIRGIRHMEKHIAESGFCMNDGRPVYLETARHRE